MSQLINKTFEAQMIGGIFSTHEHASRAIDDGQNLDIAQQDIQILFHLSEEQAKEAFVHALIKVIRSGDILVKRHDGLHSVPVIEIMDKQQFEDNPVGHRQDQQLTIHFEALPMVNSVK